MPCYMGMAVVNVCRTCVPVPLFVLFMYVGNVTIYCTLCEESMCLDEDSVCRCECQRYT